MSKLNRRNFLRMTVAGTPIALAGCSGSDGGGSSDGTGSGTSSDGGSSTSSDSGSPKTGGTLRWGGSVPVQGLDPHRAAVAASSRMFEQMTEGLFRVAWDYSLEPMLAKDYSLSEDQTTYTFDLREGVKFHNGKAFTSADVMATFERIAGGNYLASNYFPYVESMEAPDDYTFVMEMKQPFAPLRNRMASNAMHILPAEQAKQDRVKEPIGTGPFQFESREIEQEIVLTKNEEYWMDDYPYVDEIRKLEVPDDNVRLNKFKAGEVNFINDVSPKDIETVQNSSQYKFSSVDGVPKLLAYASLNAAEEPFEDPDARMAVDYCIDNDKIVEAAVYGHGSPTATPGFPNSPWETPDISPREQDFDKAKEHLDKSAYSEIDVEFKIPKSYNTLVTGSKLISEWCSEIGINLNIQQITWGTWLDQVFSKRNFKATMSTYLGHWYPDFAYYRFYHPEGAFYYTGWENEEYMQLVEDAKFETDTGKRAEMYHEANRIAHEDPSSYLLLYNQNYALAGTESYEGKMGAPDGMTLRFYDNWLNS